MSDRDDRLYREWGLKMGIELQQKKKLPWDRWDWTYLAIGSFLLGMSLWGVVALIRG